MEINEVKRIVNLVKEVNCENWAVISEVAKEMGVKKTALMLFAEENPFLFDLDEVMDKKGKVKGLGIRNCYENVADNPKSDEWLERKKKEWEKRIQVFEHSYYGVREFLFICADGEALDRRHLWRNTPEKVRALADAGLIRVSTSACGAFGEGYNWMGYRVEPEDIKAIEEAGWTLDLPDD